jgi:ABC-type uncharacterized transport system ATPase subunit
MKKVAAGSFEAFTNLYPNMMRYIPEESNLHSNNTVGDNLAYVVKLKWLRKNQLWAISSLYPVGLLEIMSKSTKNISLDSRCPR